MKNKIVFITIFLIAAFFRMIGLNWDQGQHLHPDERFLTMVATGISWPDSINEYLNTSQSPLNPHNKGFDFYVYGTFPVFLTKFIASLFNADNYNDITLIGRILSSYFDLGTVVLVFLITKDVLKKNIFALIAMFFYSVSVLPIQLSHFFAVDTYLTFFIALSFYWIIRIIKLSDKKPIFNFSFLIFHLLLGVSFGLAITSKISAVLFLPIIGFGYLYTLIKTRKFIIVLTCGLFFLFYAYLTIRVAQPYLFQNSFIFDITLNQKVLDNWKQLKSYENPNGWFPPAVQWITAKPYIYPLKNLVFWGIGLPQAFISLSGLVFFLYSCIRKQKNISKTLLLAFSWILLLFLYQGSQVVKAMRYFYLLYPFLALFSGWLIFQIYCYLKRLQSRILFSWLYVFMFSCLIYPVSFITIYSRPHPRIAASKWIYENIPSDSILTSEYWDDGLPLLLPDYQSITYQNISLALYDTDTPEKWEKINSALQKVDYIILSSNRLYGSIMTVPQMYPETYRFYEDLFKGNQVFTKVAEFTSRPNLPIPFLKLCLTPTFSRYGIIAKEQQECPLTGISFVDDYADESFTVYDHPKVLIFKHNKD